MINAIDAMAIEFNPDQALNMNCPGQELVNIRCWPREVWQVWQDTNGLRGATL